MWSCWKAFKVWQGLWGWIYCRRLASHTVLQIFFYALMNNRPTSLRHVLCTFKLFFLEWLNMKWLAVLQTSHRYFCSNACSFTDNVWPRHGITQWRKKGKLTYFESECYTNLHNKSQKDEENHSCTPRRNINGPVTVTNVAKYWAHLSRWGGNKPHKLPGKRAPSLMNTNDARQMWTILKQRVFPRF